MTKDPAARGRIEEELLPDALLERMRSRARGYDERNEFFHEDLEELRAAGYLKLLVPRRRGGLGAGLLEAARVQRRLAGAAPATALAVNMHLVWTGVAKLFHERGDFSLDTILEEAVRGEVFAFGISEPGNDSVLFDSTTTAAPLAGGGYSFTGTKIFTSLAPAWTRLGVFGRDDSGERPELVFGFVERSSEGWSHPEDWDTLGMRASQSRSTVLDGVVVPTERIIRRLPVGPQNDPLIFGIFAYFETLLAAVYTGIGERALRVAVENVTRRKSKKNEGRSYAQDPDIRWQIAEAGLIVDGVLPQIDAVAADVDAGVDRGDSWFPALVGVKHRATEAARSVVDIALRVSGGGQYFRGSELERLYRDVLAGIYHPSDAESVHATVSAALLGPLEP